MNVNQTPRATVDQAINLIRDDIRRVEYREVTMVCHTARLQRTWATDLTENPQ